MIFTLFDCGGGAEFDGYWLSVARLSGPKTDRSLLHVARRIGGGTHGWQFDLLFIRIVSDEAVFDAN